MFDSIVVRRTNDFGTGDPVDLGHLAESMIFYQRVHLALNRGTLRQLIINGGPELAVRLLEESNVNAIYLDRDYGIRTDQAPSGPARFKPVSLNIMVKSTVNGKIIDRRETEHDVAYELFQEAMPGKPKKAIRLANRFLDKLHTHELPTDLQEVASQDWQDLEFLRAGFEEAIAVLAPGYVLRSPLELYLERQTDESFLLHSNIDWRKLNDAYTATSASDMQLTAAHLLSFFLELREDLHLGAAFESSVAQDELGGRLMRAKCADLTAGGERRDQSIRSFQESVVSGAADLRGVINSGAADFFEFLDLLGKARPFRQWLRDQQPDADLIREYYAETLKPNFFKSEHTKTLRWLIPAMGEAAIMIARCLGLEISPAVDIAATGTLALYDTVDGTLLDKLSKGWRPSSFVDSELRPFVARGAVPQ